MSSVFTVDRAQICCRTLCLQRNRRQATWIYYAALSLPPPIPSFHISQQIISTFRNAPLPLHAHCWLRNKFCVLLLARNRSGIVSSHLETFDMINISFFFCTHKNCETRNKFLLFSSEYGIICVSCIKVRIILEGNSPRITWKIFTTFYHFLEFCGFHQSSPRTTWANIHHSLTLSKNVVKLCKLHHKT